MRRALRLAAGYPASFARNLAEAWDAFWFTPADPTLLAVLRILTGLMLLYTHAVWGMALDHFFGPRSWLDPGLVRMIQQDGFTYSFWHLVPPTQLRAAHTISMVILASFCVGFLTRLTSILSLVVAISYANRAPAALFGLDQINVILTLYLAIGPCGRVLSVDRGLARLRAKKAPAWPAPSVAANVSQRLINVHMCIIYFFAGIAKLQGPAWWGGEAMWRAFANLEYQSADMTWLAWHPWLLNLVTHVTVAWEMSFCVLVWKRLWRPLVLAMAVVLHVGIGACLGMWTFGLVMLIGCASFLPNDAVRRLVAGRDPATADDSDRDPVTRIKIDVGLVDLRPEDVVTAEAHAAAESNGGFVVMVGVPERPLAGEAEGTPDALAHFTTHQEIVDNHDHPRSYFVPSSDPCAAEGGSGFPSGSSTFRTLA